MPLPPSLNYFEIANSDRWKLMLHDMDVAPNQGMVARGKARIDGYLAGLSDAGAIDRDLWERLQSEATAREGCAADRTSS